MDLNRPSYRTCSTMREAIVGYMPGQSMYCDACAVLTLIVPVGCSIGGALNPPGGDAAQALDAGRTAAATAAEAAPVVHPRRDTGDTGDTDLIASWPLVDDGARPDAHVAINKDFRSIIIVVSERRPWRPLAARNRWPPCPSSAEPARSESTDSVLTRPRI